MRSPATVLLLGFTCVALFFCGTTISKAQTSNVRTQINLNNNWTTALKGTSRWINVNVPHNWDDYYGYRRLVHGNLHTDATYKKTFTIKQAKNDKRFFLFFEGVGSYAKVLLNGKSVGSHAGGRTSFTLDVTNEIITNGTPNQLEVQAFHPANIQDLPWVCGGCSEERGFSEGSQPLGIFRPVTLEITNDVRIQPFGVHAWAEIKNGDALLNINTTLKNYAPTSRRLQLEHYLVDASGSSRLLNTQHYVLRQKDSIEVSANQLKVENPVLWSVEQPYLYQIVSKIKIGNKVIDELITDFGFRTAQWRTATNQFFLNGKPVFINGVAEYEHLIGQSHAFSHEQIRSRVKWIEAAGFNSFRDGHQPHNLLYGKLFNQKGILWWTQLSAHVWYDTPEFRNNFKQLLKEWVIERRNDPSVVMWGLQNESTLPKEFAAECTELIRSLDPTASSQRLVTTCNGGEGSDWNVPQNWTGTYVGNPDTYGEDLKKQVLVGEYGAWRTLDLHTEGGYQQNGPVSEDRFAQLMEKKVRLAESVKDSVAGHYFWLLTSHDNPGRVQAGEGLRELDRIGPINYKGMLTPWEEPTDVFYMFRSNYVSAAKEPMVYIASHTWPNRWVQPGIKDSIMVYSNCEEVELFNDMDNASQGRQKRNGIGTHFMWDKVNIRYNVLYAVGYVNGKAVTRDTVVLFHLPQSPGFNKLYEGAENITQANAGFRYIYRVNAGGAEYKDGNGAIWQADAPYLQSNSLKSFTGFGSRSWTEHFSEMPSSFASQRRTFAPIAGTNDWKLFQSFRYGKHNLKYEFDVPETGTYRVELYFAEPWLHAGPGFDMSGMRLFDIALNGKTVLNDFDIWKEAGPNRAVKKVFEVMLNKGKLVISFPELKAGQAIISAIAVAIKETSDRQFQTSKANPIGRSRSVLATPLSGNQSMIQSWLDIGDKIFPESNIAVHNLSPKMFGAYWLLFENSNINKVAYLANTDIDLYVGIDTTTMRISSILSSYEKSGDFVQTDEVGGRKYSLFRKRFKKGEQLVFSKNDFDISRAIFIIQRVDQMQPAYDLKPTKSYKADVATFNISVAKELFSGSDRTIIKSDAPAEIIWPIAPGVADVYAITVKYYSPSEEDIDATLQLFDVSNNKMLDEKVQFKFTREGKWNYITVNTGSMINAGNYKVKLITKNAKGVMVSNIDVQ